MFELDFGLVNNMQIFTWKIQRGKLVLLFSKITFYQIFCIVMHIDVYWFYMKETNSLNVHYLMEMEDLTTTSWYDFYSLVLRAKVVL